MTSITALEKSPLFEQAGYENISQYLADELTPLVQSVDTEGVYPRAIVKGLGELGGFGAKTAASSVSLIDQVRLTTAVGRHCGATSFTVWCQLASAWYLDKAPESAPREQFLDAVLKGDQPAGSGMSNFLKHDAGIEKIRLNAKSVPGGYEVSGVLPWVSNLDHGHLLFTAASVAEDRYIMFATPIDVAGLELHACPTFSGMEGTSTWNVRLNKVFVPQQQVLAHPEQFRQFIDRVKPGLVLTQVGIGLGVMAGCLKILEADRAQVSTNQFLDLDHEAIANAMHDIEKRAAALANADGVSQLHFLQVMRLRASVSEWSLKASQTAALHVGARGYLMRHPAQRRLREAMFVAIVTPALKHLRSEIQRLEVLLEAA